MEVTPASGVDLHFHLASGLKLVRLQHRHADLIGLGITVWSLEIAHVLGYIRT